MNLTNLADFHRIFPYDFYASLQETVRDIYDATIQEFSLPVSNAFKEKNPQWAHHLTKSVETRLRLFKDAQRNQESIYTDTDFKKMRFESGDNALWSITYAVPNSELEKLDLNQETAMEEYDGKTIYILVQLLDENGNDTIDLNKETPDPCWDVYDPRLLLLFRILETDENGEIDCKEKIWDNEAGRKFVEKFKEKTNHE